jgi:hypothetical protein
VVDSSKAPRCGTLREFRPMVVTSKAPHGSALREIRPVVVTSRAPRSGTLREIWPVVGSSISTRVGAIHHTGSRLVDARATGGVTLREILSVVVPSARVSAVHHSLESLRLVGISHARQA